MKPHEAHDNLSRLTQVQCDKQVFKSQRVRNSEGHHERDIEITVCIFKTLCGERAPVPS